MFPYKDENPTGRPAVVVLALIGINLVVWVLVQGVGTNPTLPRSVCEYGLIPGELLGRVPAGTRIPLGRGLVCVVGDGGVWFTPVTSMFLHGGWFHLLGNMWFLWVFGNNIEDAVGRFRFVVFYAVCGLAAAAAQVAVHPGSAVPMVGASGAISGVMGAYLILYPFVRVHTLIFLGFFVTTVTLPAYLMLLYWALIQVLGSVPALAGGQSGGGVAFVAHLGGFVAGAGLIRLFATSRSAAPRRRA